MDWSKWTAERNDSESIFLQSNWSNPILRNVLHSLNSSLYGVKYLNGDYLNESSFYQFIPQAAQYGTITSIFLIFAIEVFLIHKADTLEKKKLIVQYSLPKNAFGIFSFVTFFIFALLFPILFIVLSTFLLYKCIIKSILMVKFGNSFIKMMNAIDTVWAVEEDNALSVINVIATIELDNQQDEKQILDNLKSTVSSQIFGLHSICPKMLYKRSFNLGYYFWTRNQNINIDDYIKLTTFGHSDKKYLTDDEIKIFVSKKSNTGLPYDNTASWEILLSDKPVKDTKNFPILFRIHHSLGDGVALLKLLLSTIGCNKLERRRHSSFDQCGTFLTSLNFTDIFNLKRNIVYIYYGVVRVINFFMMLFVIPETLLNQVLRPPDNNSLHGRSLNGNKIVTWISDDDDPEGMLQKIKRLKRRIPGVTFSELILTSLSASYYKYFKEKIGNEHIPEFITSVVPVRMDSSDLNTIEYKRDKIKLDNKFSVAMLTIPIKCGGSAMGQVSILKRLLEIRKETNALRQSADFYVNYGLMKIAGYVLPKSILKPMMSSEQATLVVSNLPGPTHVHICDKYRLQKMAFFVPHRGTTGIGLTILSCNQRIQLGIMADSALVNNYGDAKNILEGIFDELRALDKITSKNTQSQEFTRC